MGVKRKIIAFFLSLFIITGVFSTAIPFDGLFNIDTVISAGAAQTGTVKISSGSLNVRASASSTATVITTLPNGTQVTIIGTSGDFYEISIRVGAYSKGYVSKSYITNVKNSFTQTTGKVVISSGSLNVRASASSSATVITTLKNGASVTVVDQSGNFYKIKVSLGGYSYGYVSKDYIKLNTVTTTTTTTTTKKPTTTTTTTPRVTRISKTTPTDPNATTTTTTTTAPAQTDKMGSVNISEGVLNVRSAANSTASIIISVKKGTSVVIVDSVGSYYKIKLTIDGYTYGYVLKSYITVKSGSVTEINQITTSTVVADGSNLNVRSSASTSSNVVATVTDGSEVYVLGVYSSGWYKVLTSSGVEGYVKSEYMTVPVMGNSSSLTFGYSYYSIKLGTTGVKCTPIQTGANVTYTSSDTKVAKVDSKTGVITTVSNGITTIKATSSKYGSASFVLIVLPKTTATVNASFTVSDNLVSFITQYEGGMSSDGRFYKYYDSTGKCWTIGYGHVIQPGESFGNSISKAEAEALLKKDLNKTYAPAVDDFANREGVVLNQRQFDALVSFAFNLGPAYFSKNFSMYYLRAALVSYADGSKIPEDHIYEGFSRYYKSGGQNLAGLYRRRMDEAEMFTEGDYTRDYASKWPLPSGITWS